MRTASARLRPRLEGPLVVAVGAILLRVVSGIGFANYDTLYALAWGGQLSRGEAPAYDVPIAPTPHPLVEALGFVLSPLGPHAVADVTVWLGLLALSGCAWVTYRLGAEWFGPAAGALAAVILITRVPILSYGVRAYVDVPYLLLVLSALLVESRARRLHGRAAGTPVLVLLALAGLLRPEAWAFSGLYWLYLAGFPGARVMARLRRRADSPPAVAELPGRTHPELARLALLAVSVPLAWMISDLAITGDLLWSLTNTRHTARTLDRTTGLGNVPEYIPRRIGEILRPPVLAGAALGGVLSLRWLRGRALVGTVAGVAAVLVFALFAAAGLPINTRYAFLAAAILCTFFGAGVFGWMLLDHGDRRRGPWIAAAVVVIAALLAYGPTQYRLADREFDQLARQQSIQNDLLALVDEHSITLRCGPVGVPNHAPIPLLALYLKTSPASITSAQVHAITAGVYLDPASREVEQVYVLDPHDPHIAVSVPPGFREVDANRSWLVFQRCA